MFDSLCETIIIDASWLNDHCDATEILEPTDLVFRSPLDKDNRWRPYGQVKLAMEMTDSNNNTQRINQTFLSARLHDLRYDIMLGLPFLQQVSPIVDFRELSWEFRPDPMLKGKWTGISEITTKSEWDEAKNECLGAIYVTFGDYHHAIDLNSDPPRGSAIYPLHEKELEELKGYIEKALARGWIRRSKSPIASPILFVPKKGGELRLCVDYRGLNAVTVKDRSPIPLIENIMERLMGATVFTKLDLKNAYHRIRIRKGDEWKTAWRCRYGHFEYMVMPFGLVNAPATFQSRIEEVLAEFIDVCCIVYLDDVLIYGTNREELVKNTRRVMDALINAGLFGNEKKCKFDSDTVNFLGYIISPMGVQMERVRIDTITEWPEPRSIHEIMQFLGFCGFYRRFIRGYSRITAPLSELQKRHEDAEAEAERRAAQDQMSKKQLKTAGKQRRNEPLDIGPAGRDAFEALKTAFTKGDVMRFFQPTLPLRVETDASDFAIGAVLSQKFSDAWHPIAFMSRKLRGPELSYSTPDQELMAMYEAFQVWRRFLAYPVSAIDVRTDHMNLTWLMAKEKLSQKQSAQVIYLCGYWFTITHIPGQSNPADGPSRRADYDDPQERENQRQEGIPDFASRFTATPGDAKIFAQQMRDETTSAVVRAVAAWALEGESLEEALKAAQDSDPLVSDGTWETWRDKSEPSPSHKR